MTFHSQLLSFFCIGGLALSSCTAPLSVDERVPPLPAAVHHDKSTLKAASKTDRKDPLVSIGETLDLLRDVSDSIEAGQESAIPEYNYLLARLIEHFRETNIKPWQNSVEVPSKRTRYALRGTQPSDLGNDPRVFIPTDIMEFSGRYASEAGRQSGIGAPLVGFVKVADEDRYKYIDSVRYRDVTAIVRFEGDDAIISLEDPYRVNSVRFGRKSYRLAADFGAGASYALSKERIDKIGLARLLNPGKYDSTEHLARLQPYDQDRIPVLFVHGLQDTPASWLPMFLELLSDPEIRSRYQFWAFSYPSGYPYPMPAADLRRELDRMGKLHPNHKDIVVIGHSMGGLISRLMVTDVDERIWRNLFTVAPDQTDLDGASREQLESALIFNARDDVSRVMFFSAPHQGSRFASNWIGRIGSRMVRLPSTFADLRDGVVNTISQDKSGMVLNRMPNSIDTLSPDNRFVKLINEIPIESHIPFHSVMGDRGKDQPKEKTSDGVVAYWSSNLEGAQSERLVPSDHSSHQHPEGIEEARRVLYLHAGLPSPKPE